MSIYTLEFILIIGSQLLKSAGKDSDHYAKDINFLLDFGDLNKSFSISKTKMKITIGGSGKFG